MPKVKGAETSEEGSIAERVKAKNEAKRALELRTLDPGVDVALEDAIDVTLGSVGGRRMRGRGRTSDEIKKATESVKNAGAAAWEAIDSAVAGAIKAVPLAAGVGATVAVLNRPTLFGNLAQIAANVSSGVVNTSVTATWGQWFTALGQTGLALGTVAQTFLDQSIQGPVIPFAVATAIMLRRQQNRAAAGENISLAGLIAQDVGRAKDMVTGVAGAQIEAFKAAVKAEGDNMNIATLKEIAGRIERPTGPGAEKLKKLAATGAPAAGPGPVPDTIAQMPADPRKVAAIPAAAAALAAVPPGGPAAADKAAANALVSLSDDMREGGRRKRRFTKKRPTKKRRMTRRMPRFVY